MNLLLLLHLVHDEARFGAPRAGDDCVRGFLRCHRLFHGRGDVDETGHGVADFSGTVELRH